MQKFYVSESLSSSKYDSLYPIDPLRDVSWVCTMRINEPRSSPPMRRVWGQPTIWIINVININDRTVQLECGAAYPYIRATNNKNITNNWFSTTYTPNCWPWVGMERIVLLFFCFLTWKTRKLSWFSCCFYCVAFRSVAAHWVIILRRLVENC